MTPEALAFLQIYDLVEWQTPEHPNAVPYKGAIAIADFDRVVVLWSSGPLKCSPFYFNRPQTYINLRSALPPERN